MFRLFARNHVLGNVNPMTDFPDEVLTRTKKGEIEVRFLIDRGRYVRYRYLHSETGAVMEGGKVKRRLVGGGPLLVGERPLFQGEHPSGPDNRGNADCDILDAVLAFQDHGAGDEARPWTDERGD